MRFDLLRSLINFDYVHTEAIMYFPFCNMNLQKNSSFSETYLAEVNNLLFLEIVLCLIKSEKERGLNLPDRKKYII